MKLVRLLYQHGVLQPLGRIAALLAALLAFMGLVVWIGNPFLDSQESPSVAASSWAPPPPTTPVAPPPALPPGFPSMQFPPPMPAADGETQNVPTKFGLTYSVPSGGGWRSSNTAIVGWSDDTGTIATFGAVSDFGYEYCPGSEGSSLATVGATGRNGADIDMVAKSEVAKAEAIFADDGRRPNVDIRGPFIFDVAGKPAVRYTAVVTDIPTKESCDPAEARYDIVATAGYASAEVFVFMVEHHTGLSNALSDNDVDKIVASLHTTG